MRKRLQKIDYSTLAYAGAVPFGFGAFCLVMGWQQLAPFGNISQFLASYSLLIVAFMAGCHWAQQFSVDDSWQDWLFCQEARQSQASAKQSLEVTIPFKEFSIYDKNCRYSLVSPGSSLIR